MKATADQRLVVGVFQDGVSAESAVDALQAAGFSAGDIGLEEGGHLVPAHARVLTGMGVPEHEARTYDMARAAGRALVTVSTAGRQEEAEDILRRCAALAADELIPAHVPQSDPAATGEDHRLSMPEWKRTMELLEEELVAHVRPVDADEVVIRKEMTVITRSIEVSLKREELVVERRPMEQGSPTPGSGPASDGLDDLLMARFRELQPGQVIRLPLVEEEPVIEKRPVVYEEVTLGKQLITETRWGALNGALVFMVAVPLILWLAGQGLGTVLGSLGGLASGLGSNPGATGAAQGAAAQAQGAAQNVQPIDVARAAEGARNTAWGTLLGSLLALAASALGGSLGTRHPTARQRTTRRIIE